MRADTILLLACLLAAGCCEGIHDQGKELIMLEIERLNYPEEDKVVKRQAQVQYGGVPGQYIVQTDDPSQQQVPPEYLTLLQQLSPQQNQQQPHDIQQVFITRSPQESYAEYSRQATPLPPRPRLTPEQQQMRHLQEAEANKHIREQQERALHRALQTGQFQTGFQPQPYQPQQQQQTSYQPQQLSYEPQQPAYQPQQQPAYQPQQPTYQQPQEYQQQPQSLAQYDNSYAIEPQYAQPPSSPNYYHQQQRSIQPAKVPPKFSYSQVEFGSSNVAREALEPRLVGVQQKLQRQAKNRPEYFSAPQSPEPQVDYNAQTQQQTPTHPQHPEQYLIETTRPQETEEPVVRIPRPRRPPTPAPQSLYFRPEPAAVSGNVAGNQYARVQETYTTIPDTYQPSQRYQSAPQYAPPRPQHLPSPDAPSRSAIYVHQSGRIAPQQSPAYGNDYAAYSQGVPRIPTPHGQRPLTATEIKALSKAGFQISPLALNSLQEPSELAPAYEDESDAYRSPNSKRQSQFVDETKPPGKYPKRIPKPVPLTETERKMLADQGIRNLYRVESAESKDTPVTYVLAIDNAIMKRESEPTSEEKN